LADIDLGAACLIAFDVVDENNAPANATGVTLTVTLPDGTTATPTVTNPPLVTGKYRLTYLPASAGRYSWSAVTTVPNTSWADSFNVTEYRSIVSFAETAAYLGVTTPAMYPALRACMAAATGHVERIIGTCVPQTFTGQWVDGQTRDVIQLPHGPLLSATSVTSVASVYAGGPTWAAADMVINPEAATCRLVSLLPFWYGPWKATYTAGRTVIPGDVQEATKLITWDLWATRRWETPDAEEPDLAAASAYENIGGGYEVHGRALALLDGERRPGFG
jgi:hypothetical protein